MCFVVVDDKIPSKSKRPSLKLSEIWDSVFRMLSFGQWTPSKGRRVEVLGGNNQIPFSISFLIPVRTTHNPTQAIPDAPLLQQNQRQFVLLWLAYFIYFNVFSNPVRSEPSKGPQNSWEFDENWGSSNQKNGHQEINWKISIKFII